MFRRAGANSNGIPPAPMASRWGERFYPGIGDPMHASLDHLQRFHAAQDPTCLRVGSPVIAAAGNCAKVLIRINLQAQVV